MKEGSVRLLLETLLLGIVGALGARLFAWMLHLSTRLFLTGMAGYTPPGLPGEGGALEQSIGSHGLWLIPLVTTLGGLISGLIVYTFAPEAEGHGTDNAVKAYHRLGGFIRKRVAPLKMVASAITIGSGGSAGREGPTALISAGIGSIYATLTHRSDEERRMLVVIGMAAGLSAIFRSPIGTAIFAVEVLYGRMEFESGLMLYTMLGSVVAYAFNGLFVGWHPLFQVPPDLTGPAFVDYAWYVVLGLASGLVATALPEVFYRIRDAFASLPLPPHVKPAIGGLGVGLLALELPQVLGGGYGWIQQAIDGNLAIKVMLLLVFAKMLAFALTVSSGGSGGVFAPSLYVGAMLGGILSLVFHYSSAAFAIVGMAAVFGGAARVPMATILMVSEMTGGYQLLVPAGLAVMLSSLVQAKLSARLKYMSLYEAQVPTRADSPAHYVDEIRAGLSLIGKRKGLKKAKVGHVDLLTLLTSGIPIDLPDGKRLSVGTVRPGSPCVGTRLSADCLGVAEEDYEIMAIFREEDVLLPHPNTVLRGGDRILVITSPSARARLAEHLDPLKKQ